jgi:hypothetical protein
MAGRSAVTKGAVHSRKNAPTFRNQSGRRKMVDHRGAGEKPGNPGTLVGTEQRNGIAYARYRAKEGTWVSSSLAQQGYDKRYGKDTAYGAYLGLVLDTNGNPLHNPDRIRPGQEYLVRVGTAVRFKEADTDPIIGYRLPVTKDDPKPWKLDWSGRAKHWFVDPKSWINADNTSTARYPSFELRGPEPPKEAKSPRERVAFWLSLHKAEIAEAEANWQVSRVAIAGVIAYEALQNPQAFSVSSVGPGKMHLRGDSGQLSWPEVVESTGRMRPLPEILRKIEMAKPVVAINYIAAALDLAATIAEKYGVDIRSNPEILGQVYHGYWPNEWLTHMSKKPAGEPFNLVPGTMGKWIQAHRSYLQSSLGSSLMR